MTAVAGLRGTGDWGVDERPKNFREMILWRDPNGMAPLTALTSKMKKQVTDDPEFAWWEEEQKPVRIVVAAIATTSQTTLTIDTTQDFTALDLVAGDVLLVESLESTTYNFEVVQVSTTPTASNALAVTRAIASTTGAQIVTSTFLLKMGSAYAEGTTSPDASTRNPTKYNNYTQIFKTKYELSGTAEETRTRTGDPKANDKKRKAFDHANAMEWAFLFGVPTETTGSNGKPLRYTQGLYHKLASVYNATSRPTIKIWTTTTGLNEDAILDATYQMWDFNPAGAGSGTERIGLCGNGFLNRMNKIVNDSTSTRVNFDGVIRVYGMNLTKWILPQGIIYLRTHPLMNVNTRFTNGCFIINPGTISYRPMKGRDTKMEDGIQANDSDTMEGQWKTECGIEIQHPGTMRYLAIQL